MKVKYTVTESYRVQVTVPDPKPPVPTKRPVTPPAAVKVPASFTVSGAGWGHGVGMSQYGAQGRAAAGWSAERILEHYYAPAALSHTTSYASSDIRVQVLKAASVAPTVSAGSWRVLASSGVVVTDPAAPKEANGDDHEVTTFKPGAEIKAPYAPASGAVFSIKDGKVTTKVGKYVLTGSVRIQWQNTRAWPGGKANTVVTVPKANDGADSASYRHGFLEIKPLGGQVNVVNQLRLNDEYLYGLAEMPSSWAPAALQAQAIAGRTYAMRNMASVKSACDCNVYDEVKSQKFMGWSKENEGASQSFGKRWVAAVEATIDRSGSTITNGDVMRNNGALIDAVYFSSSGGKTRTGESVWGTDTAYLQSRDDSLGSRSEWSHSISQATMAKAFGLKNVVKVSLKKAPDLTVSSSSVATSSATATSSDGKTATLSGSAFRSKIGGTKSAWLRAVTAK